jgi:Arc/MetJ-type ribon-helix-helix transcriptional regulator
MMKIIVDLPKNVVDQIEIMVSSGKYNSYSHFILIAAKNQITIEGSQEELLQSTETIDMRLHTQSEVKSQAPSSEAGTSILDSYTSFDAVKTIQEPDEKMISSDCLWGQYNRFFPVKITLRTLASLLKNGNDTVNLDQLQEAAYNEARVIALRLKREDKKQKRDYGERLSSGLPAKSSSKTENRFKNHFVGYLSRGGKLEGAANTLKFTNMFEDSDGITRVGITESGLAFASLRNPIIDEDNYDAALGEEESEFLLKHIFNNLEREKQAVMLVLKGVSSGVSTPDALNEALRTISRDWSDAMLNTIRAGLVSRLSELGLLDRQKKGTKVQYLVTEKGRAFLSEHKSGGDST